ncbi:MAG: serine hydrolase domain-containing protein [Hyphomonadaceae bacterium]
MRALASSYAQDELINGAMLVADANGIVFQDAYGLANREWGVANTLDTRFRIGSVTKVLTVAVVMQLRDEGVIDLAAPASRYLTTLTHPDASHATVNDLLSHRSGLPRDFFPMSNENVAQHYSTRDLIERVNQLPAQSSAPGSEAAQAYSNINYVMLAAIIEAVTGESWADNVQRRIFDRVGMRHSQVDQPSAVIPHRASGYVHAHGIWVRAFEPDMSFDVGGGGVYSTVGDLYMFARALIDGRLVSEQSLQQMFAPQYGPQAFAWRVMDDAPGYPEAAGRIAHHRGRINGFTSQLTIDLTNRWVFVSLNNIDDAERWQLAALQAAALARQDAGPPPADEALVIVNALLERGVEAAIAVANEQIARSPAIVATEGDSALTPLESELNRAAFTAIEGRQFANALALAQLNQRLFPGSANARIALGYAHALAGDYDAAAIWVARTRELDPENSDAAEVEQMIAAGRAPL